ncbi:DNA topoisomerase IB [Tateyamaria omphalii]|uniref:DNA topoisomerase n=1 Tax=Tateyamaria omphalii TaxID=299262 RepID=A0A1P8N145_9RHOB|nr:DNA topoisomerase IB [Tateyamaria omphalii]APX13972.1 DNA topoisomerase [Tateyamaria omphalii]
MSLHVEIPDSLIWYADDQPGITRRRAGRGFSYIAPDGTRIDNGAERKRIEALAVPPAYEDVWISPRANGHLLATGYDARTRKQYRYHPDYMTFRAQTKFDDLATFGQALPRIRRRVQETLTQSARDEEFAIAATLRLMDKVSLRVGTPDYAADNDTYGATTLRARHVRLDGNRVRLDYRAKGGQRVRKQFSDRTLNRALEQMGDLPGGALMQYEDNACTVRQLGPEQVNAWLRDATGREGLTAKTFRTWNGSASALDAVLRADGPVTIKEMAEAAAEILHNTPTIARNSYIHPEVIALAGADTRLDIPDRPVGLRVAERALLALLA